MLLCSPLCLGHADQLREPGSLIARDLVGLPLLLVRDRQGEIGVFLNVCRHRGARLVAGEDEVCVRGGLTCPYHGWTYDLGGALRGVPAAEAFPTLDKSTRGLRRLPSTVRHGLIWAILDPRGEVGDIDVSGFLGGIDDDLATLDLGSHRFFRQHARKRATNWKLVMDAFQEVYHIHGSIDSPTTMVITTDDYNVWAEESKYFAAKLLTYFAEHPVFVFGYGLGDPNVQTVLRDIGSIVADETGLISNVIQVVYSDKLESGVAQSEFAIPVSGRQFRIRVLNTESLLDVFQALTARHELKHVNTAMVRALAARAMKLTRSDIPNGNIEVDYKTLEGIVSSEDMLPSLLGITQSDEVNKTHPHLLSSVGEQLGFNGWNSAHKLLEKIKDEKGVDIKATDNKYHCAIKVGKKDSSVSRKYSPALVNLLECVRDGKDYNIEL